MNVDYLMAQLHRRCRRTSAGEKSKTKSRVHRRSNRLRGHGSSFESLEPRQLLAGDVTLAGNTLVVTETGAAGDDFSIEVDSGEYQIASTDTLSAIGFTDLIPLPTQVGIAIGSITGVNVIGSSGDNRIEVRDFVGRTANLNAGGGDDTYELGNSFGDVFIVDAGGGSIDLSNHTGDVQYSQLAGQSILSSSDGSQAAFAAGNGFSITPSPFDTASASAEIAAGLSELADLGDELATVDRLNDPIALLNQDTIGDYLPIGQILRDEITQPIADYFAVASPADPAGLINVLSNADGSSYTGPGGLNLSIDATALVDGDVLTVDLSVSATLTHNGISLSLDEQILGLDGQLDELLNPTAINADLTTGFSWDFKIGVDASAAPFFFAEFPSDIAVTADINQTNASFDLRAGLLSLEAGAFGPASAASTISLDVDTTIDTSSLAGLDGTNGGTGDGVVRLDELQNPNRLNSMAADATAAANVDVTLYLEATGVSGITDSGPATITYSDDEFSPVAATFTEDVAALGLNAFFKLNASSVLQSMQQFGDYLELLSLKSVDNERILIGESATIGDMIDVDGLFRDEFLTRIELPPFTSTTGLTEIVGTPESGQTLGQVLGTSGDFNPEFTIKLQDGTAFDVDVEFASTLGDVAARILAAGPGVSKFEIIADSQGGLSLIDKTSGAADTDKFEITPKQNGASQDYDAAANLGLTAVAEERDVAGGTVRAIDLAPNPGANFVTLQEMLSLPTPTGTAPQTTVGPMSFDAATSTFSYSLDITKTFANASDTLLLPDFGSLSDLVTVSTVDLLNPTVKLHLPFEVELTELGFDTPLSESTNVADLNGGGGITLVEAADDVQIDLANGTSFNVDFDAKLGALTFAELNSGAGITTSGDANAELTVVLSDGTTFDVDLDANVDSTDAPPTNLDEIVQAIQQAADAVAASQGALDGLATIDAQRGTLRISDTTGGAGTLSITGSVAAGLGLDGAATEQNDDGNVALVIEHSMVTVGDVIAKIEAAAVAAGLTIPTDSSFTTPWDFDVHIDGAGIVMVDRTAGGTPSVTPLNDSGAHVSLGLTTTPIDQPSVRDAKLYDGQGGVVIRTNGTATSDLIVILSGGTPSFGVNLDGGPPLTTIGDVADRIAAAAIAAGINTNQFDVWTDPGTGEISFIDRAEAGAVSSFSIINVTGSFAATDLGLSSGVLKNVDFNSPVGNELDGEYVIELKSTAMIFGGGPLHGDTVSSHVSLVSDATPNIEVDLDISAAAGTGSGLFGPVSVDFSDLSIAPATSKLDVSVALETATVAQLWKSLGDPFAYMVGDRPDYNQTLDLDLKLKPVPSVAGVDPLLTTDFAVDIANLYDVRDSVETVTPVLAGSDAVKTFLVATEQLTISDVFAYLDSVGDYLLELQTQSRLAERLPGLSTSIGDLFGFGDAFKQRVQELKELPEELRPKSLQTLNSQLSAPLSGATLLAGLSFDVAAEDLLIDLQLYLNAINAQVPVSLDLTKLGLDRTALGLQKVAAIVDTLGSRPLDVNADGQIDVELGIDLSTPASPVAFLSGDAASGSGTEASFDIRAINNDALVFTTLLGSLPAEVISGSLVLDIDGDGPFADPATYSLNLQSDANLGTTAQTMAAASDSSTTVQIDGKMDATFEMLFPQQVIPGDAPNTIPFITVSVDDVNAPAGGGSVLTTNMIGGPGQWPTFEILTQNFSLADSMDGFKLGFYDLFSQLDEALDTSLLGHDLPLVGDQLADAADFLLQMRDSVVDNLNLYGSSISVESVQQGLFDAFGPGGFDWLQNDPSTNDAVVNVDDVKVVTQTVTVSGRELVVGVEYQMDLMQASSKLQAPVDLDLLMPGLGLEFDALADVMFGFHLPLSVGVSIADGVYIDVERANDLEINLEVALPSATAILNGDPRLVFTNPVTGAPKIAREQGSWVLDGFRVGQIISVSDSALNDGDYVIAAIDSAGLELTLKSTSADLTPSTIASDRVAPEGPSAGIKIEVNEVSQLDNPTLTFTNETETQTYTFPEFTNIPPVSRLIDLPDTITRSSGSWSDDGFTLGDTITITGSASNNGQYRIQHIDASGRKVVVDKALTNESTGSSLVRRDQAKGIAARLGVLPFRVHDQTPDQPEVTGTFVIDWLDPAVVGGNQRLALNDLIAEAPFPNVPADGFNSAPLPDLLTISEIAGEELTVHPISLMLETDLPSSAAFPPFRMQFDVTNWDWDVVNSLPTEDSTPTVAFNDVQFELVGFVRDFLGPAITRTSTALEAVDPLLVFLQSEAMPIVSMLFGRASYASAPATFGGQSEVGDFTGAVTGLRALANGGQPFERDVIGEFFSDIFESNEFDDVSLLPIMSLTGEEWIDLGRFVVDGAVARGASGDLFDSASNVERALGKLDDAPRRLVGRPDLVFSSNAITLQNAGGQRWTTAGFASGQTIRITGGPNAGTYVVASVSATTLVIGGATFGTPQTVIASNDVDIAVQNADGTRSGSIFGQVAAIARNSTSSAQDAANSFVTTQLLPGLKQIDGIGGLTNRVINNDFFAQGSGLTIDPIDLPIFQHSFGLLLGETGFDGRSEEDSILMSYGTPELALLLYHMQPLDWEEGIGKLINPLIGKIVGKPLDNAKYTVPFVSISFEARADYHFAFDTTGLQRFGYTGNPDDIVDGFYFDDFEGVDPNPSALGNLNVGAGNQSGASGGLGAKSVSTRMDETQVRILGGVGVGAFVDPFRNIAGGKFKEFIQARVGFELSLHLGQDQNFHDPNNDGRIRANEFDVLTGFSQNYDAGTYSGTGTDAFDEGLRIELRGDVFASVTVGIFLTQRSPPLGLKISVNLFSARINIFTIGFTIPIDTPDYNPPNLGNQSGGLLTLVFSGGDNVIYVGASSAKDDAGRQDIVVSGHRFHEVFKGISSIIGTAGAGNDAIFVMPNVLIPVNVDGGAGNDTIVGGGANDTLRGGVGNDRIDGGKGHDTLHGDAGLDWLFGGDGNDQLLGGSGHDVIRGWRDDDNIDGGDGDDLIDGGSGADIVAGGTGIDLIIGGIGRDTLRGGAHRDRIEGGRDADTIEGGDDDDVLLGGLGNDAIDGGGGKDELFGEQHNDSLQGGDDNDLLDGGLGSDRMQGGAGDDLIKSNSGNDILDGQIGDDTFQVLFAGGKAVSFVQIVESGPAEDNDVFVAIGTLQSDQFLLRASVSGSNAFVALLHDPDHAATDPAYDPAVQRINYLGVERIIVNGGLGNDRFAVDDTSAEVTLNGEGGEDEFQIGQLFRSERTLVNANVSVEDVFATIETTRGFLSNGISAPMTINGGLGNDRFVVFHNKAVLSLNGDEGDDDFEVRAFALVGSREPERARTDISGGAGADLVQYAVNAPVNINGGDGFDTLTVIGTEFGDDFVVTDAGVFGAGLTINFTNIESLRVDGAEGNDRFFVKSTSEKFQTELFGGLGDDTFNMSGDTPPVVSNDLRGHSGIVTNDVTFSNDFRYEDLKLFGVSSNVADNEEPYVVIRTSGGPSIISETSTSDSTLFDFYEVVLSRAPLLGFDVLLKALAPLPSPDRRELGAFAFRLTSPSRGAEMKADGSVVTLRFTADNWHIPQRVEIRADGVTQSDTGRLFTRPELSQSVFFDYNDDAFEGQQSGVINHLVVSSAATIEGSPRDFNSEPTITIATDRPFYEFLGENISVTLADGVTVQHRRIIDARLVDGDMQLTVDRSWLAGSQLPDATSTFSIDLDGGAFVGSPLTAANATFAVADPLDPRNPYIDDVNDFLGRQVTIIDGLGTGQSRFITGAEAVVTFNGSAGNIYTPNTSSFSLDLSEGTQQVDVTSGATLNVYANADFDHSSENLTVNIDGTNVAVLFGGNSGRQYSAIRGSVPLTQAQLQSFLSDGQMNVTFTPSSSVNNLESSYSPSHLSFDMQFTVNATTATFNKGVLGDIDFTLDRGWNAGAAPDLDSRFQIRIDDSLIGKVTAFDETPVGLPVDPSFPPELDTRTTFSDAIATFDDPNFGSEGLRGATLEIVGGPGAGQQRLILGTVDSHTLIVNGGWRTDPIPGESLYRIARFDGLAVSSVGVETHDNDQAGLIVDETKGFDSGVAGSIVEDYDTITAVIEGGDGDQVGEREVVRIKLSRQPTAGVDVALQFDGVQLSIEDLAGNPIAGNTLSFTAGNWDVYQDVVVIASHDLIREGFHTRQIKLVTISGDTDTSLNRTDNFVIPNNEPVEFVGLSQQPTSVTSVTYNGQTLNEYDPLVVAGSASKPVWQLLSNKIVFLAGAEITTVLGSDLHVSYSYTDPGYDATFTHPVLVRISDADAPTVLVRETDGSTDVVEGAASFTTVEFSGGTFADNFLVDRVVTVSTGTGAGQSATVIANSATTLTLDQVWTITPDATSTLQLSNDAVIGTSVPSTFTGSVAAPFQRSNHQVYLIAGGSYSFSLEGQATGQGSLRDPFLFMYDASGRYVAANDDGGIGLNSHIVFTPNVTGTYTLSAGGYGFSSGSYKLFTDFSSDIPANTSTPARLPIPSSTNSALSNAIDEDWFQVDLEAGNSYTFDLEGAPNGQGTLADPLLALMDATGVEVVQNDDVNGTNANSQIIYSPTVSGKFYLAVQGNGGGGTYRIRSDYSASSLAVVSADVATLQEDTYELVLTAAPDDGTGSGNGIVEVTVAPEVTKTTRTGGVRTDAKQVEIYNLDGLPASRVRVDPSNADNLIVAFDQSNWDTPVRIGVRAIDDAKVDGGDTKVFANGPNTLSEILGPVVIDGAGGDGSLVGIGPPEILPHETNVKERTGDVDAVNGFEVTLQTLTPDELLQLGIAVDLSNVGELVGKTIEVVATHPTDQWLAVFPGATVGSTKDPVMGQFRLITAARADSGKIIVTLNERFGIGGDVFSNVAPGVSSTIDVELSREQRLRLGIGQVGDLRGRYLEVHDAASIKTDEGKIVAASDNLDGTIRLTVETNLTSVAAGIVSFFIRSDDLIKSYAITSESQNFFVDEPQSVDYMFIHDEDSPADSTGYLTSNRLWGLNMGPDVTIGSRLRSGGITYGNLEVLQIDLGDGNNDFNVLGTHARADDPLTTIDETFQTWTIINGGDDVFWPITNRQGDIVNVAINADDVDGVVSGSATGGGNPTQTQFGNLIDSTSPFGADDGLAGFQVTMTNMIGTVQTRTIIGNTADTLNIDGVWSELPTLGDTYTITNPADGALAVNLQGGDDLLDASGSTLGVVAFGGLGLDTLTGGAGEDVLFGDQGRVDYFGDDDGIGNFPIVTRLGTAQAPISGTATGDFADDSNLLDAAAAFPIADGFDVGLQGLYVDINNGTAFLQTPRLITDNTTTSLSISPDFTETLDATSAYRISTFPEDQTDGVVRGANMLITVNDMMGDADVIQGGAGDDQIFGGAGDDDLNGNAGDDLILGDTGVVERAAQPANASGTVVDSLIDRVRTKTPADGGEDLISGDDGDDIIFGGFGTDYINFDRSENQLAGESGDDLIVGDGGIADYDTTSTQAVLVQVETNEPTHGSTDFITAGAGEKIIFGGAGDDQLLAGSDNAPDIIIGDEGVATFNATTGLRTRVATTTSAIGGTDTITGGNALNLLLGGSNGDNITGGNTQDIVIGDNGEVLFDAAGDRLLVHSIDPTVGGADTISGLDGNDIIIGGTDDDTISGGAAHDVILGDHGEVDFTRTVDRNVISRSIGAAEGGGNDTIDGDDGDDFVWGGQGDDTIRGGAGQDDLVGGHNVPFGSDGNDTIDGGDDEDVILGDNGLIKRELLSTQLGTWTNYLAPFDSIVVRDPQPFDDRDLISGDDTLSGGGAMDIIRGQRGEDEIHGGDDDDELIGGLGSDTIFGDTGQDFILADAGQILRDLNSDGTPQLNSDGTWHRDLLTERIARVTDIIPLGPTGLLTTPADLADRLLDADQIVLASIHLPSGAFHLDADGHSQNAALLLDLVDADDDMIDGRDGNDFILGQRGDDTIRGGAGDDALVGDHGVHVAPMETDVPQMIDGLRLIGTTPGYDALSGIELDLPGFGKVLVPDFVAQPGELVAERPRWDRVASVNDVLAEIATEDQLKTADDLRLSGAILLTPHFIGHQDVVDGSDTIYGEDGDDLIFGDGWIINSDLNTGIALITSAIETATASVAGLMHALEALTLDRDVVRYDVNSGIVASRDVNVGNDTIEGGDGVDTVIGDTGRFELPSTQAVPGAGTATENAETFLAYIEELRVVADDAINLVSQAHLGVIDTLLADAAIKRPTLPVISGSAIDYVEHHRLVFGEDTIRGNEGDDLLLGGDATLVAPFVTGLIGDLPDSAGAVGFDADSLVVLNQSLNEQSRLRGEDLAERRDARIVNPREEIARRTPLNRIEYVPSIDRELDGDTIEGGIGRDLVAGDFAVIATPLVQTAPTTPTAVRDLDQHVEVLLDQISNHDRPSVPTSFDRHVGRLALAESATDAMSASARHGKIDGTWSIGEDTINGNDGDDRVLGDHAAIVSSIMVDDPTNYVSLRRSAYSVVYLDDSMRTFLEDASLSRVNVGLRGDRIDGNDGDDELMGSVGDDRINGNDGDDTILGGNGDDTLRGDAGSNTVRNDGGNYPRLNSQEAMGTDRFTTTTPTTAQLLLDAAAGAQMPVAWTVNTGVGVDPGDGDPDSPTPPTPRNVTLSGAVNAVTGQPTLMTAAMTDLPAGATPRFMWELVNSSGTIVAVAAGSTFPFKPATAGVFTVNLVGTDSDNGKGVATLDITVHENRLLPDPDNPGQFILVIGGTDIDDDIRMLDVNRKPNSVEVRQRSGRNPRVKTVYDDISRIEIYTGDGDDDVTTDRRLTIPVRLYGGAGNDRLRGGAGNDYLDGGAGDDRLQGEGGNDVIVGGLGADRIDGGNADDLLVGDELTGIDADQLLSRWSNSADAVADRFTNLIADLSAAITADRAEDDSDGERGNDWYLGQAIDEIHTRTADMDLITIL